MSNTLFEGFMLGECEVLSHVIIPYVHEGESMVLI